MTTDLDTLRETIIQLRRALSSLETRRAEFVADIPSELLQEFVETSHQLEKAEQAARQAAQELAQDVNRIRARIQAKLDEYNRWRTQMLDVERTFLTSIVRPGYRLREAVHTRSQLERERKRIQDALDAEGYADRDELEEDIRDVLLAAARPESFEHEEPEDELPPDAARLIAFKDLDADLLAEAFEKEEVVQEFRRIVLPATHPDTSDTDPEIFLVVREVYKNLDYLLMQAYTVQYRGDIQAEEDREDRLALLDEMIEQRDAYLSVLERLSKRIARLKDELTAQELEDPEALRELLAQRSEDIRERIQKEAEQILALRAEIAALAERFDRRGGSA